MLARAMLRPVPPLYESKVTMVPGGCSGIRHLPPGYRHGRFGDRGSGDPALSLDDLEDLHLDLDERFAESRPQFFRGSDRVPEIEGVLGRGPRREGDPEYVVEPGAMLAGVLVPL